MIKLLFVILFLPVVIPLIVVSVASAALSEVCHKILFHLIEFKDSL